MVCLLAAPWMQLFNSMGNGWLHSKCTAISLAYANQLPIMKL